MHCHGMKINFSLHHLSFIDNRISLFPTANEGAILALSAIQGTDLAQYVECLVALSYLNFTYNKGTPLSIIDTNPVNVTGDIVFIENNALTGGGMYIGGTRGGRNTKISLSDNAKIIFINNIASYGGSMYVDQEYCFLYPFLFISKNSTT